MVLVSLSSSQSHVPPGGKGPQWFRRKYPMVRASLKWLGLARFLRYRKWVLEVGGPTTEYKDLNWCLRLASVVLGACSIHPLSSVRDRRAYARTGTTAWLGLPHCGCGNDGGGV